MTDQAKQFIKKVNSNKTLFKKFSALAPESGSAGDLDAFIQEKILPFAEEAGFVLTIEDFKADVPASGEISDEELMAVAGGECGCVAVGAGEGVDYYDGGGSYGCGCVLYGQGGNGSANDANCFCTAVGEGASDEQYF